MARNAAYLMLLAALLLPPGCASQGGTARAPARPPANARPESVVLVASSQFVDTDANGYRDTNQIVVYVFTEPRYRVPIEADGSFQFTLVDMSGRKIRDWSFSREEAGRHRIRSPVGPGFAFTLSLLDRGGDAREEAEADLLGEFTPAPGGAPIRFRPSASVVIGRVRQGAGQHRGLSVPPAGSSAPR